MSDATKSPVETIPYDPLTEDLLSRAAACGIETEVRELSSVASPRRRVYVLLKMPNGRATRSIPVFPRDTESFLAIEFEKYILLGDYLGFVDSKSGRIEAQIMGNGPSSRIAQALQELPGAELTGEVDVDPDIELSDETAAAAIPASTWRLGVDLDGVSIEISPVSSEFDTLLGGSISIKIDGVATSTHDQALEALEKYGNALLFDLDLVYGIPVQVAKKRQANRPRHRHRPDHAPRFPRNTYASQALQLYQYGRTSAGLPLLEYLAYYQSVEYFFPFFAREQTVHAVRSQLLHPGFDALNDVALNRLINLAAPAARAGMAEREQMRATVRACVEEANLRSFLESAPEYMDHFCSKRQTIKGVDALATHAKAPRPGL